MYMILDFVDILGWIRNDTGVLGKALIFNIIDNDHIFDCVLFVHPTEHSFISVHEEDSNTNKEEILKIIFEKYTLKQLLEA